MKPPLEGVTVVDLTSNMAGPYATLLLAEQGATVIKVEALTGDIIRRVGSGRGGMSGYFANLNRGKSSIAVDVWSDEGRDIVRQLAASADVFVQAFRPGVAAEMGLGADDLRAVNARLVYASISGFGADGPLANEPAYDHVVQALTGMAALQRGSDDAPQLIRHGVIDKTTGMSLALAVTAALLRRERDGVGCEVEVTMLDAALHFLWPDGMMNDTCLDDVSKQPPVSRGFRLTKTRDGHVALVTVTDRQWEGLIDAMNLPGLLDGIDVDGAEARMRNGGHVMRKIAVELATWSTEDVVDRLRRSGVPCMAVVEVADVAAQDQVVAAGSLIDVEHPVLGRIRYPRPTHRTRGLEPMRVDPAPTLGSDTTRVLRDAGYDRSDVERLAREGIIGRLDT